MKNKLIEIITKGKRFLKRSPSLMLVPKVNVKVLAVDTQTNEIVQSFEKHNLVVRSGRNLIRDWADNEKPQGLTHFALGTDDTEESNAYEELGNEVHRNQVTKTVKDTGKLTVTYYLGSGSANGYSLKEAGLFNDDSEGSLYARVTFTDPIEKNDNIAVTFTWELSWEVV